MAKLEDIYPSRVKAEPAVAERRDPVVYSEWSEAAPITREQTEFFRKNGYLVIENAFDADELGLLQGEGARLSSGAAKLEPETAITEPGSGAVRSVFKIHKQSDIFWRLAADAR
ncbi:MAG: hypothetical protein RIC52_11125, partial [Amphiplicatus sp.]